MPSKRKTPTKKHTKAKKPQPSCKQRVLAWNDAAGVWLNKHPRRALAYGVGGIIAVFLLSQLIGSVYNRYAFMYVQKNLSTMSAEIAKETNPTKTWSEDYCRRQSVKYGKGALSCTVERWAYYSGVENNDAILRKVVEIVRARFSNLTDHSKNLYTPKDSVYLKDFAIKNLLCGITAYYYDEGTPLYDRAYGNNISARGLYVSLSCTGDAAREYFPTK